MRRLVPVAGLALGLLSISCGQSDMGGGNCTDDTTVSSLMLTCPADPHAPATASRAREAMGPPDATTGASGDGSHGADDGFSGFPDGFSLPDGASPEGGMSLPDGRFGDEGSLPDGFSLEMSRPGDGGSASDGEMRPGDLAGADLAGLDLSMTPPGDLAGVKQDMAMPPPPDLIGADLYGVDFTVIDIAMPGSPVDAISGQSDAGFRDDGFGPPNDLAIQPVIHDLARRPGADYAGSDTGDDAAAGDDAQMSGGDDAAIASGGDMGPGSGMIVSDHCLHAYDVLVDGATVRALRDSKSMAAAKLAQGDVVWAVVEHDTVGGGTYLRAVQRGADPLCGYLDPSTVVPSNSVTPALRCVPGSCPAQ